MSGRGPGTSRPGRRRARPRRRSGTGTGACSRGTARSTCRSATSAASAPTASATSRAGRSGACGITMAAQQSRIVLLAACIGAATHTSHARELVEHLVERNGRTFPLDPGGLSVDLRMPNVELVCGLRPETLADLETVLDYCDGQLVHLLAATHTGQEGDPIDFESKVLHAGMVDHVSMEVADVAQISALDFPKADPAAALVEPRARSDRRREARDPRGRAQRPARGRDPRLPRGPRARRPGRGDRDSAAPRST